MRVPVAAWILLALLLPLLLEGIAGQPAVFDEQAQATIRMEPMGSALSYTPGQDPLDALQADPPLSCRGDPFVHQSRGFRFDSLETEAACGRAVWMLDVPDGAKRLLGSFLMDRRVDPVVLAPVHIEQSLLVIDPRGDVLLQKELFPPQNGSHGPQRFAFDVALPGHLERIALVWWIDDQGIQARMVPDLPHAGVRFQTRMDALQARFDHVPVPGLRSLTPVDQESGGQRVRMMDVEFIVPEAWFDQARETQVEVELAVRGAYDPYLLVLPGGRDLRADDLGSGPQEQVCRFVVPASLMAAGGPGRYVVRLTQEAEAQKMLPGGDAAALVLLATPFLLAGAAIKTLSSGLDGKKAMVVRGSAAATVPAVFAGALVFLHPRGGPGALLRQDLAQELRALHVLLTMLFVVSLVVLLWSHARRVKDEKRRAARSRSRLRHERQGREAAEAALYAVAHDLRSPLVAVHHLIEEAVVAPDRPGQKREQAARRSLLLVEQMDDLVQQIMGFAQAVRKAQGRGKAWVQDVVQSTVEQIETSMQAPHVRVVVRPSPQARLDVPEQVLASVLGNLVSNGVKYCAKEGGLVRVSWRRTQRGREQGGLELEVADNGPGVPEEDRQRVFRMLTRLPDRQGRDLPGTGVGLAVVERVVRMQEGEVQVRDAPEGGALFVVRWPPHRVRWTRMPDPADPAPRSSSRLPGALGPASSGS